MLPISTSAILNNSYISRSLTYISRHLVKAYLISAWLIEPFSFLSIVLKIYSVSSSRPFLFHREDTSRSISSHSRYGFLGSISCYRSICSISFLVMRHIPKFHNILLTCDIYIVPVFSVSYKSKHSLRSSVI